MVRRLILGLLVINTQYVEREEGVKNDSGIFFYVNK
jgi:hypothetical protein